MNRLMRWFIMPLVALGMCFTALTAFSAQQYTLAPVPQPVTGDKVEVIEFFWYGCNHCYALDPKVSKWAAAHPNVTFRRVHTPLAPDWVSMTKAFYAMAAMNKLDKMHQKMFDAMHKQNIPLDNTDILFDWVAAQGIDKEQFKAVFNSFAVQNKVKQAEKLAASFRLTGVPAIIVDRKYITSLKLAGDDVLVVLDQLVEKAQNDRKKAKK